MTLTVKDILIISLGDAGKQIATKLERYGYTTMDATEPLPDGLTFPWYDDYVDKNPSIFYGLIQEIKKFQRVIVVLGSDQASGASGLLLHKLWQNFHNKNELYLNLYLKGENGNTEENVIEQHLYGVFSNKARSCLIQLFVSRENELSVIYGDIFSLKNMEERYYQQVADQIHTLNIFKANKITLSRTSPVNQGYFAQREEFAKIMTYAKFQISEDKIVLNPFYTFEHKISEKEILGEEFVCVALNVNQEIKDKMHKFLPNIQDYLKKHKNKKVQFDFYNIDTIKTPLSLGIFKSTIAAE
jgi:hypothetical protein